MKAKVSREAVSFLSFVIIIVCTNKNQRTSVTFTQSPQLSTKKTLKLKEMAFVCVFIRSRANILKPWNGRSVVDRSITLQNLFCKFASGEFDDIEGRTSIFEQA